MDPHHVDENPKIVSDSVKRGLGWSFSESLFDRGLALIVKLYLVRLLMPEAFGLVGMAAVFTAFLSIMGELGMAAALIQRKQAELTEAHWQTAFTLSFIISTAAWFLILIALAPFAAVFYGEPEVSLILSVLGFGLVIDSFSVVPRTKLVRGLRFKTISITSMVSVIVSSTLAILMAYNGYGVWALVARTLTSSLLKCLILWIYVGWLPRIRFSKKAFRELFGFSAYVFMERMLMFLLGNIDYALIGKLLGATALGIYALAFTLTDIARKQVMGVFNTVLFPVYAKLQDDRPKAGGYFLKVVRYNTLLIAPLMFILLLDAEPIILLFFGQSWQAAAFPLQILALGTMIHTLAGTSSTLIRGLGYAKLIMIIHFVGVVLIAIPAISAGAVLGGINGASLGVLANKAAIPVITLFYVFKLCRIGLTDILKAALPSAITCGTIAFINFMLHYFIYSVSPYALISRVCAELLAYAVFLMIFLPELKEMAAAFIGKIIGSDKDTPLPFAQADSESSWDKD